VKKGYLYAFLAYGMWGVFPLYWKALQDVPSVQILAHRVVWSLVFLVFLISLRREWEALRGMLSKRVLLVYALSGALVTLNWGLYIWGVNANHVVEASLGYFINPLVNVLLGVVFLRERLRPAQWAAIGLALMGVLYMTLAYGRLPWLALALAFTFGIYGYLKKTFPLNSLHGLTLETGAVTPLMLAYLVYLEVNGQGAFLHGSALRSILLALAGVVTATPLLFFGMGARLIPLSTMGLIQYLSPTIQFLLGVFLYHEPFDQARLIGFGVVWLALALYLVEGYLNQRRTVPATG
jgi:chloramphenicol-sensitive protein RarD